MKLYFNSFQFTQELTSQVTTNDIQLHSYSKRDLIVMDLVGSSYTQQKSVIEKYIYAHQKAMALLFSCRPTCKRPKSRNIFLYFLYLF